MKYLSVCSGIEAATVAWHHMGWEPVGFSEIEKFPSEVLSYHYPNVTNFGDMTKYKEWKIEQPIGLLVGGTPCQSFSVAGLRKGLEDPRGNLALIYCGILDKFRPKWFIWENVPGVLSSSGGRDFGSFLGAVAELGYGFAYRVLDAQYFGVAQRRRRVFVVGHLGDWKPAAEVLFEQESLRRDIKKSRKKGEITPTLSASGTGVSRVGFNCEDEWFIPVESKVGTLLARDYKGLDSYDHTKMIPYVQAYEPSRRVGLRELGDKVNTLQAFMGTGGNNVPIVSVKNKEVAYNITFCDANGTRKDRVDGGCYINETDKSNTITAAGTGTSIAYSIREDAKANNFSATELEVANAIQAHQPSTQSHHAQTFIAETVTFPADMNFRPNFEDGVSNTLLAKGNMSVAYDVKEPIAWDAELNANVNKMGTLLRGGQGGRTDGVMMTNMAVRRLTPKECERLQGFPDNYTQVPWRKGESPDGVRYKALGNSMAVPVMKWIGERINAYSQDNE